MPVGVIYATRCGDDPRGSGALLRAPEPLNGLPPGSGDILRITTNFYFIPTRLFGSIWEGHLKYIFVRTVIVIRTIKTDDDEAGIAGESPTSVSNLVQDPYEQP